jgi:hypothetical protein
LCLRGICACSRCPRIGVNMAADWMFPSLANLRDHRELAYRVCPHNTACTNRSRPNVVRRAFLWMFIRFLRGTLKSRQRQLPRFGSGGPIESSHPERARGGQSRMRKFR